MGQDTFTVCGVHITFGWLRSRKKGLSVPTATVTWLLPLVNSGRTSKSDLYPQWIFFVSRKKTHNQYIPLENLQPKVKWRSAMLQTFHKLLPPWISLSSVAITSYLYCEFFHEDSWQLKPWTYDTYPTRASLKTRYFLKQMQSFCTVFPSTLD